MLLSIGNHVVALDAFRKNADINFISHAHSDHTKGLKNNSTILTSYETAMIFAAKSSISINHMTSFPDNLSIDLMDSGHMLGSKQICIEDKDTSQSILYSGDYQMHEPYAAGKLTTKVADTLILDSTYPYPGVVFDDPAEVAYAMQKYTDTKLNGGIVLYGAYPAGKAQDIIMILNEAGIKPVVSDGISKVCDAYVECGVKLDYVSQCKDKDEFEYETSANFAGIVEFNRLMDMKEILSESTGKRVFSAVATGFAKFFRFNTDVQFPLSDHADFKQSVEYIEMCNPKRIITVGKESERMAKELAILGYNAFSEKLLPCEEALASGAQPLSGKLEKNAKQK